MSHDRQRTTLLKAAAGLGALSSAELERRGRELAWRGRSVRDLAQLLPEVFPIVIEAARRTLGLTYYPVQVQAGIELFRGRVIEMQTGEGKTVTAVLPAALRAMAGRGCHVVTVNDYLARRDAESMGRVYGAIGLTVGCIQADMDDDARRDAYARDITYGTASQFGFDFLRDRLKSGASLGGGQRRLLFGAHATGGLAVQRVQYFALVDEADSILIDEAKTPLIIGAERPNRAAWVSLYRWSATAIEQLRPDTDFKFDLRRRQAFLTPAGCRRVTLLSKPTLLDSIDTERIYTQVEQALTARHAFQRDKDYVVIDDAIAIVDEGTGRILEGRKWQAGLHQSIEAKEGLPITPVTTSAARVTIQTLFRGYEHVAGMTGTAVQVRRELKRVYGRKVSLIPTHRPSIRIGGTTRLFVSLAAKRRAVIGEVRRLLAAGRAVLVGTPSVEASVELSSELTAAGIEHVVLNAREHASEAEIVAKAGGPGRVTIATNMAGRGTDILLDESVRQAGGLHVIATEMHTSARIDRQLVGRAARQGDPGSFQFFLSLEDELLRALPPHTRQRQIAAARPDEQGELPANSIKLFRRTQRHLERLHSNQRRLQRRERELQRRSRRMGIDPYLELVED
ncbi:MAG: translocase [Planctomycetaceae bacterium]